MIQVYCENITPRHRYIFEYFIEDVVGVKCELTEDPVEFSGYNGPKFSYGKVPPGNGLHLMAHPLLWETGTKEQSIDITSWEELPVIFTVDKGSELPFDPFALVFYLVSRYEEYLPFHPDEHGRFPATASLAYRERFLDIPLVDLVGRKFRLWLAGHFPGLEFYRPQGRFTPTFDIDLAFAHLGKGWVRASAAWMKLMLTSQFGEMRERFQTLAGRMADPYDNFAWQQELTAQFGLEPIYFALVGDFSRYDRNVSHKNPKFRNLIDRLSRNGEVGIHPSYRSYLNKDLFEMEKKRLQEMTGKVVTKNRFHFLRMKFPESYRILLDSGITDDYSLGYSMVNGFRAGTFTPFYFYDIEREEKTSLKLHPFIFMDSAFIDHLKYTPEQAVAEMEKYLDLSRDLSGELIATWHNYALSEKSQYKGWRKVLQAAVESSIDPSL